MKQKKLLLFAFIIASAALLQAAERASNMFTADPSAHVWQDGRLYVYPSTDIKGTGYGKMDGYHVFSTDDMITWMDHGEIFHSRDLDWGIGSGWMWAPDAATKNGTYYFYFPRPNGPTKDSWKIGVATSKKPASDFKPGLYRYYEAGA